MLSVPDVPDAEATDKVSMVPIPLANVDVPPLLINARSNMPGRPAGFQFVSVLKSPLGTFQRKSVARASSLVSATASDNIRQASRCDDCSFIDIDPFIK